MAIITHSDEEKIGTRLDDKYAPLSRQFVPLKRLLSSFEKVNIYI